MSETKTVEFYFDYSSPFTYLAATQIRRVVDEAAGVLVWRPFFLGGLFKAIGAPVVPLEVLPEAKRSYQDLELTRWAARWGVPFSFTPHFPLNTIAALRLTIAAPEDAREALVGALMRRAWVAGEDLAQPEVLNAGLVEVGLDGALLAATKEPAVKDELRRNTEEAVARGVFGAPSFFVGDELFWGQDRLDFVAEALRS